MAIEDADSVSKITLIEPHDKILVGDVLKVINGIDMFNSLTGKDPVALFNDAFGVFGLPSIPFFSTIKKYYEKQHDDNKKHY